MNATLTITSVSGDPLRRTEHVTLVEARRTLTAWAVRRHCQRVGNGSQGVLVVHGRTLAKYTIEPQK
jgi:hypothetical protein